MEDEVEPDTRCELCLANGHEHRHGRKRRQRRRPWNS